MQNQKSSKRSEQLQVEKEALASMREKLQQAQKTLQANEKIKQVLDTYAAYIITDPQGIVQKASEGFCHFSGYKAEELIGKNANFISSGYHSSLFWTQLWQTISRGKVWKGEIQNKAKDGSIFWIDMIITPLLDQGGQVEGYVAIRSDLTFSKQAQAQLRFDAHILAHISEAVIGLDAFYLVNFWNEGAQKQYGLTAQEVMGRPLGDAYESIWLHSEDEPKAMQSLAQYGSCSVEIIHKIKRGTKAGKELYIAATTQVLLSESGQQTGLLAILRDVTARKQVEQTLQHTLQELEKRNHELDNYVYKVSHDLRAPLTSMQGLLNLIKLETDLEVKAQYLALIENRVGKLDEYIQSILHHSKMVNATLQIKAIDFESMIVECFEELKHYNSWQQVSLTIQLEGDSRFHSDEFRLTVILKNIITNAIKYSNSGASQSFLHFHINISPSRALIRATDNGVGIDAAYIDKIFDMFFRASASAQGSGLGLYIVKQAIEKLQGSIRVESQKGRGTTFIMDLPNLVGK
ncbi:PAS domain-containing sensor histidine kinase [Rhodocytophaga aerolata]|uniref:histidine kinase n=1 Tax=Rhodocytophaga aerolata TaxID=455078 RepID=A0ABT8RHK9_9BACT|nr:PAS domain-containing sensor histidine kinase [Rhodocytophaga aerolata]MDO1451591.1 PAS domain-containing sensor histidine kinase [Rhodocytophaga aerolata]